MMILTLGLFLLTVHGAMGSKEEGSREWDDSYLDPFMGMGMFPFGYPFGGEGESRERDEDDNSLAALWKYVPPKNTPDSFDAIFPGTKWCGPGNEAESYDDLGRNKVSDACCRTHDHCNDTIPALECLHGICNNSTITTMSHCDCDEKFRKCLQAAKSSIADKIGYLYFNVGQLRCFRYQHPIKKCVKHSGPSNKHCEAYELDFGRTRQWQAFDQPRYVKISRFGK